MKHLVKIISVLLFTLGVVRAQGQSCCPKFTLGADFVPCDSSCIQGPNGIPNPGGGNLLAACRNTAHIYRVFPNLPGFTYTWTVTGGTPASYTGNPITINWGNSSQGLIQVIIKNADSSCRDTIIRQVCLVDGPQASFTFAPNPVCLSPSLVQFTNTSIGGSAWYWDFGDGSSSTLQNPAHAYSTPGTYVVILTVSTASGGGGGTAQPERDCKCRDTASATITVSNLTGIDIHTDDCRKMLCTGDTVKYCTSTTGCSGLTWSAPGGQIINGQGTTCITVVWNQPSVWPTLVTLNAGCPGTCGNTATLPVNVLYPNLPIQGPSPVCQGSVTSYSLPNLPGTFYKWTLSGGGFIVGPDSNVSVINVHWTAPGGTYIIRCDYKNPYSGCSGWDTIQVTIRPRFQMMGPSPVCTTTSNNYLTNGPVGLWTFTPPTGFSNTPIGANGQTMVWTTPGNYIITATPATPANFCTASATINVVVNPTPILNPISGPGLICPNALVTYSVTSNTPGGAFTWTLLSGTGTLSPYGPDNSSVTVNFTGSGPWQLQASQTVNNCTGTISLPVTKVGPPPPISVSPPGSVCSGGSITASVTGPLPPGGYTWSATPGAVLTGANGGLSTTFTVNSNATITVTSCGGSSSISITVNPATVTITPTSNPCGATLTASPGGGTYNWFLNGNPYGSGVSITATQNGTYVVQATYAGGCVATSQYTVSNITPLVAYVTAVGNICNGGSVTLTSSIPANCPGAVFTWSNGFVGNPCVVTTPGTYSVTVTCSNGCSTVSNSIVIYPCGGNGNGNGNCIPDLNISPSACNNPVALTTNIPSVCSSNTTTWYYGDGGSNTTGIHTYNNVGNYTVSAVMTCGDGSVHCGTQVITIPMIDSFTSVISCGTNAWSIQLQDASLYLPAYSGYTLTWSASCGTLSATNIPNPVLTVNVGCNPTVTLTISKNGCTLTKSFTFSFPTTTFAINGPNPVCANVISNYSSNFTTGVISYNWTFGDIPPTTGVTNPISHAFTGNPLNPVVTLTITDQYGCNFTTTTTVNVIVPRALNITPSPLVQICPDCAPPVTLTTSPTVGFTGYQWYHNGVAISGANLPTYQLCNFDASGTYYVKADDTQNGNCQVTSDTVKVVYLTKPTADIQGATISCSPTVPGNISLANGATNPNWTYVWTATGPGTITFSPDNLQSYASVTVSAFGQYQFIITVTDTTTGCIARDTACIFLYQTPNPVVSGPAGPLCEGMMYTFTVTSPTGPNFAYQWSNGVTGPSMTTSVAGMYFVTVTNINSGCSAMVYAGMISKRPNVSLFPLGCDTLCDTVKLIPPLPLGPGQTYGSQYTIKWYVDGNLYFTGPVLTLAGLTLNVTHQIHVVVIDNMTNCSSQSGDYNVYLKHCGDCDCKESHWGQVSVATGDGGNPDGGKAVIITQPLIVSCGKTYDLKCNQPYTINASYFCKDSSCNGKVTYTLQPPTGFPNSGTLPLTFTPAMNGIYTLTLYGWCGNKICDSCVIYFKVKDCKSCNCDGSKWNTISLTQISDGGGDQGKAVIGVPPVSIKLTCKKTYDLLCNQAYSVNAGYQCKDSNCNAAVTYTLQPPAGLPVSGTVPLIFTPNQNGIYTLTLYGWCGNKICDSCVIYFKVKCDKCNCDGSKWGELTVTDGIKTSKLNCGKSYDWKCKVPFTISGMYVCADPNCPGTATYILNPPAGAPLTGTLPLTMYTPTTSGNYNIMLIGMCGGKPCDTCRVTFHVDCPPDTNCCKHDIKIQAGNVTYSSGNNSTIATQTFTITGLAGVPLTEVRAEVLSYDISSNYNNECLNCKTLPFTWASIGSAGNIGAVAPGITLYGGATTSNFNPSGTAVYQNPREVIWSGNLNINAPISINFLLPPQPTIDCCELKGKICVKFIFRDENCNECEVIACFDFSLKKK